MIRHLRPRLGNRLDLLREEIRKFKAGAEDESRPGAARVVKLSTVHKAKGLGYVWQRTVRPLPPSPFPPPSLPLSSPSPSLCLLIPHPIFLPYKAQ